jgi:hypothetical protein
MIDFNDEHQVMTDEMGLPLAHSVAMQWLDTLIDHVIQPPEKLAEKARKIAEKRFPSMIAQMDFSPEHYK